MILATPALQEAPGIDRGGVRMTTATAASASQSPLQNQILAALPTADFERVRSNLEPVALPLGLALYESGSRPGHVHFLTEGIVSLLYVMQDGASAEIAVTGSEGMVGISLFMG